MESEKATGISPATSGGKKSIGVKVDEKIWRQFRALAISQGRTAGDLLDELMVEYVEKANRNRKLSSGRYQPKAKIKFCPFQALLEATPYRTSSWGEKTGNRGILAVQFFAGRWKVILAHHIGYRWCRSPSYSPRFIFESPRKTCRPEIHFDCQSQGGIQNMKNHQTTT
jgi:hypothetical protein